MIEARATDFASWRARSRELLRDEVLPADVLWTDGEQASLFSGSVSAEPNRGSRGATVPPAFLERAALASEHCDPERFSTLYRLLWKITHGSPHVLTDPLDADAARLTAMVRDIREEEHRMHAFVRFRPINDPPHGERWVAWFAPRHRIVRRVAPFFARRYPAMRWTLFTPDESADWDTETLRFGPGASRDHEAKTDDIDALFLTYYENIFNPARTNLPLAQRHIPARIQRQLPEGGALARLGREAVGRVDRLRAPPVSASATLLPPPARRTLHTLAAAAAGCRACPIGEHATQTVFGEGEAHARVMLVGEQPGDEEDRQGHPFVGPAGKVLDGLLAEAELPRDQLYVTNAVKHFKWEPRGKRRLHSKPNHEEVVACHAWLLAEVEVVKPRVIVCLGATAAQSFAGASFRIRRDRGKLTKTPWAPFWLATYHPSALLRAPDAAARRAMEAELLSDLKLARSALHDAVAT